MTSNELKRKAANDDVDVSDDEDNVSEAKNRHLAAMKAKADMARQCPYLDTINRNVLDFGENHTWAA
jgi:hypothetical protein